MAAEEDVDSFIIKPYTVNSLEKSLVSAVIAKVYPSDYMKCITEAKELIVQMKYDEAYEILEKATSLSKTPSLALFYQGQINYMKKIVEAAKSDYKKGLEVNAIHFKCQLGLYDLFMKDNKIYEAYEVIRNIMKYFPSNPERIKEVLKLSIQTKNYEDIEFFYDSFKEIEVRDPDVVKHMSSALYILGKHYFMIDENNKALESMKNVMTTCQGDIKFVRAVVTEYAHRGMFDAAKEVFKRSSYTDRESDDYKISEYLANYIDYDPEKRASQGLQLFNGDVKDPFAAEFMLNALYAAKAYEKFNALKEDVIHLWPDLFTQVSKDKIAY
jgi:tetratricopeptide (TPR) repeat protein